MLTPFSRSFVSQSINRDATFGLTARFFRKRAVFKKTSSNKTGQVAIPKAESDALGLRHNDPVNLAIIKLDNNFTSTVRNVQVKQDPEGFFSLKLPEKVENDLGGFDMDELAPLQFVMSKVGTNQPNPANQISPLDNRRRGQYTASKFLVYKSYVSEDNVGPFVTIEKNERDYYGIEPGDTLSVTTIPISGGSASDAITRFFNSEIRATVEDAAPNNPGATSVKVRVGGLLDSLNYDAGTLVQVIAIPV